MPPSCALLGGFAIGERVVLLWQHNANAKCQRVLVLALCPVDVVVTGMVPVIGLLSLYVITWSQLTLCDYF